MLGEMLWIKRSSMHKRCDGICHFIARSHLTILGHDSTLHLIWIQLGHEALHGAIRYDEAMAAFEIMLHKLDDAHDAEIQGKLNITHVIRYLILSNSVAPNRYMTSSEAQGAIRKVICTQMEKCPASSNRYLYWALYAIARHRSRAFETNTEYKKLLSSTMKHASLDGTDRKGSNNVSSDMPCYHIDGKGRNRSCTRSGQQCVRVEPS